MQSRQTVHITAAEWRWVILIGSALVLFAFSPLLWVALRGTSNWQFMGALHNYQDGATYISKMRLGFDGGWLVYFQHTPEQHSGAFIQVIYLLLGHLARLIALPPIVMFHVARAGAALFMYVAIYQLGASIWMRVRARRIFFSIAVLGAGLGWLIAPLMQTEQFPDFAIPEAFPFYSTFMNVHFPLTIACLALLVGLFVIAYRPGADQDPTIDLSMPLASVLSVALALLYPQALVPVGAAISLYVATIWWQTRRLPSRLVRWALAVIIPAISVAVYYMLTVIYNPAMAEWNQQNVTMSPPPLLLVLGFGIPLLVALPGIYRAIRRFERDGDRLFLLWVAAAVIAMYLPLNVQRRFAVGLMIPIGYFATRAIEDVWLPHINRRWRAYVFAVFIPMIAISQVLMLFLPVLPAIVGEPQRVVGIFLERDYAIVYDNWLSQHTSSDDVVLASPLASVWIPGWAGARVVYGHPYETLDAAAKQQAVVDWYAATGDCSALLDQYHVRYVIYGPEEAKLGAGTCVDSLQLVQQVGSVRVYAP